MNDQQMRLAEGAAACLGSKGHLIYADAVRSVIAALRASGDDEFKNFHRLLCERFGYTHDERDWRRDQVSLIEWIALRASAPSITEAALREAAHHAARCYKKSSDPRHADTYTFTNATLLDLMRKLGIHVQK